MTTPPRLLAGRMPEASTPSRRYRCAASSLTASSLQARVRHEARGFSVRKPSDETQRQHSSITERLHLKFAAGLFKEWGPPLNTQGKSPWPSQGLTGYRKIRLVRCASIPNSRKCSATKDGGGPLRLRSSICIRAQAYARECLYRGRIQSVRRPAFAA